MRGRACQRHINARFRVVASNEHGSTNSSCLVTIKSPKEESKKEGEEPRFIRGLVDQYVSKGDTIVMQCEATGDPTPEFKVYKNGTLLKPTDKITIDITPDGKVTITIKDAVSTDEGLYRVEAVNPHGKDTTQAVAHVDMTPKPEPLKLDEGEAPRFIIEFEDISKSKGDTLELACKASFKSSVS